MSKPTTTKEDNKEVEIVSVDVMDVGQKLRDARADVPFIKNVIKAHRRDLNECQYTKLEKLVNLLEQNGNVSITCLHKIEDVIGKLKARFSLLLTPIETIDISHPNSATSTPKQQITTTLTQTNPIISTSTLLTTRPHVSALSHSKNITDAAKLKANLSAKEFAPQSDVLGRNNLDASQKNNPPAAIVEDTLKISSNNFGQGPQSRQSCSSLDVLTSNRGAGSGFVRRIKPKDSSIPRSNPSPPFVPPINNLPRAVVEGTLKPAFKAYGNAPQLRQTSSLKEVANFDMGADFVRRSNPEDNSIPISNPSPPIGLPSESPIQVSAEDGLKSVLKNCQEDFTRRTTSTCASTRRSNQCACPIPLPTINRDFVRRSHTAAEKGLQSVNPLEEARKKLAALRGDTPLASNSNDPRGRRHNYKSCTAVSASSTTFLSKIDSSKTVWPRTDESTSVACDIPKLCIPMAKVRAPQNLNLIQRSTTAGADLQSPNTPLSVQPLVQVRKYAAPTVSPTADMSGFSSSIDIAPETRQDLRWANKYSCDPRLQNSNYYNECKKTTWSSNGYGNGQNRSGSASNLNALGRLGGASYSDGDAHNRFQDQVPRTYREHREAKARAETAEALEQQRQFLVDFKRQQEADKKRQLEAIEKQHDLEIKEKVPEAVTAVSKIQLDTSYRNCVFVGASTKKIDFRIPKKTMTIQKNSTAQEHLEDSAKDLQKSKDKTQPAKCSVDVCGSDKTHKKLLSKGSANADINTFNLENEPPLVSRVTEEVASSDVEVNEDSSKERNEKSEKATSFDKGKKRRKSHSASDSAKHAKEVVKDTKVNNHQEKNEKDDKNKYKDIKKKEGKLQLPQQKLTTKIKIVGLTGPSPQTKMVINREAHQSQEERIEKKQENSLVKENPASSQSRILKRRNTMAPKPSEPLIDKHELFNNCSLMYEDMQDRQRSTNDNSGQLPQSKDNSLDKSIDYCSVSAQNIITGKRRTRVTDLKDHPASLRIMKRRNTMAPIASEPLVDKQELFTNCSLLYEDVQKLHKGANDINIQHAGSIDNLCDKINDNTSVSTQNIVTNKRLTQVTDVKDVPAPAALRIVKRRNTMAPIASEPLVDKNELFTNCSLLYEDMQARKKGKNDNLFEKTIDNCTVSTQNIITGKRRTRGLEVSFNETLLSRKSFKMGPVTIAKTKSGIKSKVNHTQEAPPEVSLIEDAAMDKNPTSIKRKRGRSSSKEAIAVIKKPCLNTKNDLNGLKLLEGQEHVVIEEKQQDKSSTSQSDVHTRVTKTRRPKRNELDKLNEDIAQMYYGEEVMRASGRRACTLQHKQPVTLDISTAVPSQESPPIRSFTNVERAIRNVARRGVPFSKGPRNATDGCNRASYLIKKCRVNIRRSTHPQLIQSSTKHDEANIPKESKNWVLNINIHWHALSSAARKCIICDEAIKKNNSAQHYIQFHGEPYSARLAPGMLSEIRQNRGNRPAYSAKNPRNPSGLLYHYTCPFCKRVADLSTPDWYDHLAQHTGELRFQCSRCLKQFHRRCFGQGHVKSCHSDAELIASESYTNRAPITVHVCQLCEFVQKSKTNLLRHLQNHHGIKEQETNDKLKELLETVQLYRLHSVSESLPENKANANSRTKIQIKSRLMSKNHKNSRKVRPKKRFRKMAKKAIKLVKNEDVQQKNKNLSQKDVINDDSMVALPLSPAASKPDVCVPLAIDECKLEGTQDALEDPNQETDKNIVVLGQGSIPIIELQDDDNLSGIGSDESDEIDNQNGNVNNITNEVVQNRKNNLTTDEWIDLENVNRNAKSKSIFTKFNRFCTRLKKNGEVNVRAKSARSVAGSSNSESSDLTPSDPNELMPKMTPLEPPVLDGTSTSTALPPTPPTLVENVAFRRGAYFCSYPKCTFLYSNEVEGLENHFALEHPSVRWSGNCLACQEQNQPIDVSSSNLPIAQELLHMVKKHMEIPPFSASQSENDKSTLPPSAPKLRVRRFSGDRLVPEVEKEPNIAKINNNTMLKDLLNSSPRPPNQQIIDFHAAGLGEFLTTKNLRHQEPVLVNHASGLGLSINKVFSLAPNQTLPHGGDFIVTQSCLTKSIDDQTPAQINISIKPATSLINPASSSIGLVADRFRCMAPKCGYCAHTVMCIREHMKFHSYSFGSNDYLKCAYCRHISVDVKDYVHHGVTVHGLASAMELEPESGPKKTATVTETHAEISVAQQIRDVLNQRNRQPTTPSEILAASSSAMAPLSAKATEVLMGPAPPPVSAVVAELIRPTGFSEEKLYGCPYKGCSVSLNGKIFVSHIRFHIASTHNQDAEVKCKYCNICLKPTELRNHLQKFHGKHSVFCAMCLATTLNRRIMYYHMKTKHEALFLLFNRQLHFLQLPADSAEDIIELAAIEHPFGKKELQAFHNRLNDEWLKRQRNTKVYYHHSELGLLPKVAALPQLLRCADCNKFETLERKLMQLHLNQHKVEEIANAYQTEKPAVTIPVSVNASGKMDEQVNQSNLVAEPPQPGQQRIIIPKLVYVPTEKLYHCGNTKCSQPMPTELALRQHLAVKHNYKDQLSCVHCKCTYSNTTTTEAHIEHLELHKPYVYQCGGCSRLSHKRALIERHIQERHQKSDVDVIIYRRDKIGDAVSSAKWFKAPKLSGAEYMCNLCQHMLPSVAQIRAHALVVHKKEHQYYCQYCSRDFDDPIPLIRHLLAEHPNQPVEPVQVFQRLAVKNKQTLGFFCLSCHDVANTRQKISSHCEVKHECKQQFKCPHCSFGHSQERNVSNHMLEKHPFALGRAIMQFERVSSGLPNDVCWAYLGNVIEDPLPSAFKEQQQLERQQPIIVDEIELISSSDEETTVEEPDNCKSIEFACSYCHETSNDVELLRSNHWAHMHADRPFYFRVQPQLLCPECKQFKGSAKSLLENHLVTVHGIGEIVACDVQRPKECAFCEYRYTSWQDLAHHMKDLGHLANDLKNVTDVELHALRQYGTKGGTIMNEYYQCVLCKVIMPTCLAMGQHGRVQHSDAANFCFRRITDEIIYHCFNCMYASTEEMETLRHMLDHYPKYQQCQFCHGQQLAAPSFEDCLRRHRHVHPYADLKKYLMEIYYQFQNGFIITKSSLRRTKYCDESLMKTLDKELMRRTGPGILGQPIAKRRKTVNADQIIEPISQQDMSATTERETRGIHAPLVTSSGSNIALAPSSSRVASFPKRILKRRFTVVVGDRETAEPESKGN